MNEKLEDFFPTQISTYNPDIEIENEKDLIIEKFQNIDSKIYNRLKELRKWDFDPDCDDEKISLDSLKNFYDFHKNMAYNKSPSIVTDPNGKIHLEWYDNEGKIILLMVF